MSVTGMATHKRIQESGNLFPTKAQSLLTEKNGTGDLIILDVCTPKEFAKLHLENAVNLNFFSRRFNDQLKALDRTKTYLVYCKVGGRSKMAQRRMQKLGFDRVHNLVGGSLLWAEEGLPFAPGMESPSRFSLCPIFLSMKLMLRVRRFFQVNPVP